MLQFNRHGCWAAVWLSLSAPTKAWGLVMLMRPAILQQERACSQHAKVHPTHRQPCMRALHSVNVAFLVALCVCCHAQHSRVMCRQGCGGSRGTTNACRTKEPEGAWAWVHPGTPSSTYSFSHTLNRYYNALDSPNANHAPHTQSMPDPAVKHDNTILLSQLPLAPARHPTTKHMANMPMQMAEGCASHAPPCDMHTP